MIKLKKAKLEEEEKAKLREKEEFNNKCDYLNKLDYLNRQEQQKMNKIYHDELFKESQRTKENQKKMVKLFL